MKKLLAKRVAILFVVLLAVLLAVNLLKGHSFRFSLSESLLWASISSFIYFLSAAYWSRRKAECMLCDKIAEHTAPK